MAPPLWAPPAAFLAASDNGMYRIEWHGAKYRVIVGDAVSDRDRDVDAARDPKMKGTMVAPAAATLVRLARARVRRHVVAPFVRYSRR